MRVDAVLFDLDDTLYPQQDWLAGAWRRVADAATAFGVDRDLMLEQLHEIAAEGSGRGRIIDRALERCHAPFVPIDPLVQAFRMHEGAVDLYPGARGRLASLRAFVPIAIVTDGDPVIQRKKIHALGIANRFDAIVLSDEFGRDKRKPHPAPFVAALRALFADAERTFFVGDRPDKDIAGARATGMRTIRVRTGEYAHIDDRGEPWQTVTDVASAIDAIIDHLAA